MFGVCSSVGPRQVARGGRLIGQWLSILIIISWLTELKCTPDDADLHLFVKTFFNFYHVKERSVILSVLLPIHHCMSKQLCVWSCDRFYFHFHVTRSYYVTSPTAVRRPLAPSFAVALAPKITRSVCQCLLHRNETLLFFYKLNMQPLPS